MCSLVSTVFTDATNRPAKLCETENCVRIGKETINF